MRILSTSLVAVLVIGILVSLPVQAQGPVEISMTASSPAAPINATQPTDVTVSLEVGCVAAIQGDSVEITSPDAPAWLTIGGGPFQISPDQNCVVGGSGTVNEDVTITLTPSADAPGLNETTINLEASNGEATSDPVPITFQVEFVSMFTLEADITFPYTVTTDVVNFNVTIEVTSNARSMVMIEEVSASEGTFSGLSPEFYEVGDGPRTFAVIFTPPDGGWTSSNVTFYAYNHATPLGATPGPAAMEMRPTWEFLNDGSGGGNGGGGGGGGNGIPGPGPILLLAVLALAFVVRRRD